MAKLPAALVSEISKLGKKSVPLRAAIASYEQDEHTVSFRPRGADEVLAGEDGFDVDRYAGLGFLNDDLPLFVDVSKKACPVFVLADGEPTSVARSFDAFIAKLATEPAEKPAAKAPKSARPVASPKRGATTAAGPAKTVVGPAQVSWPTDAAVAIELGQVEGGKDFLWFDRVSPKASDEDLLRYVKPQGFREKLTVGARWNPKATMRMDRGTGVWLDVAAFDKRTPVVTPRVREILERIQPEGLEFLPVKAEVGRAKADLFIVNVTRTVPCLDVVASGLPMPPNKFPYAQATPKKIVLVEANLPSAACFFRVAEIPMLVLASKAMVDALRGERLSGIRFVSVDGYRIP